MRGGAGLWREGEKTQRDKGRGRPTDRLRGGGKRRLRALPLVLSLQRNWEGSQPTKPRKKKGGRAAAAASRTLPGPPPQQQTTGAQPGPSQPPSAASHRCLHSRAWASLGTVSGLFFLAMLSLCPQGDNAVLLPQGRMGTQRQHCRGSRQGLLPDMQSFSVSLLLPPSSPRPMGLLRPSPLPSSSPHHETRQ